MPTEALTCPTCGANDSSGADAQGLHTCVYCGVRYRITGGHARALNGDAKTTANAIPMWLRITIVGSLLAGVLVIAWYVPYSKYETTEIYIEPPGPPPPPAATPPVELPPPIAPLVLSVEVEKPPEPEAPAVARFVMDHKRPGFGTTFYAVGFVTNESPYTIDRPKIVAVMKDAKGAEIATAFGFADEVMAAGEKQAVQVLVMEPPEFATIDFEIAAKKASYIPPMVTGIELESGPVRPAKFGNGFEVAGKVAHRGTESAKFVQIRALAFDANDKILGFDYAYADADADVLDPGKTARWNIIMQSFGERPTRWEMTVSGRKAG